MALGEKLKKARLDRGLTTSEIAAVTRMKVQMVEDLEKEDFSKVAATIYGKGFIRLFAEQVGLDSAPLIEEYLTRFVIGEAGSHDRSKQALELCFCQPLLSRLLRISLVDVALRSDSHLVQRAGRCFHRTGGRRRVGSGRRVGGGERSYHHCAVCTK